MTQSLMSFVRLLLHPPLKQRRDDNLKQVEWCDVDILVRSSHKLHRLLGKEGQIFVVGIFVNVFVSRVVERNENIEEDSL